MNRKAVFAALAAVLAVLAMGCHKKRPQTTADIAMPEPEPVVSRATEVPSTSAGTEEDIWSADLGSLNQYIASQGLLADVYFDFDRSELRADARDQLARNAEFLRSHPELVILVEGHCDERDTAEYNLALGDARASTVRGYLGMLGIGAERVRTISYGEERPVCTEPSEGCWWRNRRGHFVVADRLKAS